MVKMSEHANRKSLFTISHQVSPPPKYFRIWNSHAQHADHGYSRQLTVCRYTICHIHTAWMSEQAKSMVGYLSHCQVSCICFCRLLTGKGCYIKLRLIDWLNEWLIYRSIDLIWLIDLYVFCQLLTDKGCNDITAHSAGSVHLNVACGGRVVWLIDWLICVSVSYWHSIHLIKVVMTLQLTVLAQFVYKWRVEVASYLKVVSLTTGLINKIRTPTVWLCQVLRSLTHLVLEVAIRSPTWKTWISEGFNYRREKVRKKQERVREFSTLTHKKKTRKK